jgi:phosphatidate cytidylyltransferase
MQILLQPLGATWFLIMLFVVFSGDVGAYIFGLSLGKNKLMPQISPKKTIEGSLGGFVFSIFSGLILLVWIPIGPALSTILLCFFAALFAQMGDLFESLLKRVADVKDSGRIFPGHGGLLDRIDGILFACPVFLLGLHFFN